MNLPQGWTLTTFDTILNYEQPTAYIVKSTEYNDNYKTAVLTAGKSFIIGYTNEKDGIYSDDLPVIIFDDFTTAIQYVTFPFKVKSSAMKILQPINDQFNKNYIYYYMQTIKHNVTTHKRYWISDYSKLNFPLPPLSEQQRIVDKIDSLFSELENGITMLKTIKAQLLIYRQAVLKWAFEGKLTNTVMQEKKKLEDMCFFITKGTTPKKEEMSKNKGDIPFIKVYNLTFIGVLDFTIEPMYVTKKVHNNFLARSKVIPDDVLMNIVGPPLGKVSIIPNSMNEANINQAIVRFRCKEQLVSKYLLHFLLYEKTIEGLSKQAKTTAGQINLTLEICRNLEIPICSKSEQQAIVSTIESRLSVCDKLEQTIDQTLALSASLRQSILKKAFEGRLVPQDPNDEPAEKLLERIKAEKATVLAKQKQTRKRGKK